MISRLERSRGVVDYARAAEKVKAEAPAARFLLAGPPGTAADAITARSLAALGGAVEHLDPHADVRHALGAAMSSSIPRTSRACPGRA